MADLNQNLKQTNEELNNIAKSAELAKEKTDEFYIELNNKMKSQFGKGPAWEDFFGTGTFKESVSELEHDLADILYMAHGIGKEFNMSFERFMYEADPHMNLRYTWSTENTPLGKHALDNIKQVKFNELADVNFGNKDIVEAIEKETQAVVNENKAQEERARLLEEGRKRAAENAAKDQSAGTWTAEELDKINAKRSAEIENLKKYLKLLEDTKNYNSDAYNGTPLAGISLEDKITEVKELINQMEKLKNEGKNSEITKMFTSFTNNDDFKNYRDALYEINADAISGSVSRSIKSQQNDIKELVDSIARINVENGQLNNFEWLMEIPDEIQTDTALLEQFKQRLIEIYKLAIANDQKIRNVTEFGSVRGANERYEGFKVTKDDMSENVREAYALKDLFESSVGGEEEAKRLVELLPEVKKAYEEYNKLKADEAKGVAGAGAKASQLMNSISSKYGLYNIDEVEEYKSALGTIKDFTNKIGKEAEGTSSILKGLKENLDEMSKSSKMLEYIVGGGDNKEQLKSLLSTGDYKAEKVDLVDRQRVTLNENIAKSEEEGIKQSKEYQNALETEEKRIQSLIGVLNQVQEIKKSDEKLNRDVSNAAQANLWEQDIETIGRAEVAIGQLQEKINRVHNTGLIGTTNLDILPADLRDIKTVLTNNYGAGFDEDTKNRVESIRDTYNEILGTVKNIVNETKSEAGQEEIINNVVNSIVKHNREAAEARKAFNENSANYEKTLAEDTKQLSGYNNTLNKLNSIVSKYYTAYNAELNKKGITGVNADDLSSAYKIELEKKFGIDKIIEIRDRLEKEIQKIKDIYAKAGQKIPDSAYVKTDNLLGLNREASILLQRERTQQLKDERGADYSKRVEEREKEAQAIDKIKEKLDAYNQQLSHINTQGIDKILEKLAIYNREIDKAIQKNDIARAKSIFGFYQDTFSSISGVQKGQDIAAKRQAEIDKQAARESAEAAKERAKAESDAAKATADAQKQWESQVNNLKNKVQEVTGYIKQAIANTIKVIRTANNVVNKSITVMVGVFEKLGSTVQRLIQLFGNFGNRLNVFNKQGNILKGTYTELKSKIDLLVGAFNKLYNNSFINEGKKLLSSVQTLNMLIGTELTTKTMEWATNLEHAFGLSAAGLIADLKELTAVMYGLGMSASDVQVAATNLEAVAMSLSATTGYDFSTVVNKIQSGMKGMTQSIDDLGLSVRESQMDAFLRKLKAQGGEYANIGTSFSQLTEQQRIYVRYAAIMDQFTSKEAYSAENYAKSLRTITGSLSILNSQIRGLKSDIGSLALQLFAKIIQPLIYIIYLVRQAVKWFANLLGIDITLNPKMNGSEDNVIQPIEDTTKALDEEAAAADKAKGSLDGLDHVSTMSESSSKNKGDAFDYSSLMNISDDYAKLLEDLGKMQDDFIEECKRKFWEMVNSIKDKFTKWIKDVTGRIIDWDKIKENWDTIVDNLKKTWQNIVRIFQASANIIGGLLYSIFDDLDATTLLAKFSETIEKFTNLIAIILERVQPYIQNFYDKYLSKYVIKFGDWLEQKLDEANAKLDEWIKWWEDPGNDEAIQGFFDRLGERFEALVKTIKEVIVIFKALFGGSNAMSEGDLNTIEQMGSGMKSVYDIASSLHNIFADVLTVVKDVGTAIFDLNGDGQLNMDDLRIALDDISEKFKELEKWVDDNKEKITAILTEVINTVTELGKAKFEVITKLIDLIVQNADTITAVLRALQDVIKWAAEHPVLAVGISVAGQTAVSTGKTILTAMMWKKILGLGAGGAASQAAAAGGVTIGGKIVAGIKGAIASSKLGTLLSGAGATGAKAVAGSIGGTMLGGAMFGTSLFAGIAGAKEGFNDIIDGVNDTTYAIDSWIAKLRGVEPELRFTSDNYKTFAYEVRRALTEAYGQDIDTSKAERAFKVYAGQLQQTYNLTDEETEALVRNIERQYNRIGSSLDGATATLLYSTDYSENNIKRLETAFETLDNTSNESTTNVSEDFKAMSDDVANSTKNASKSVTDLSWKTQQVKATVHNTFRQLAESIYQYCAGLNSRIQTLSSNIGIVVRQSDSLRQASQRTVQQSAGWTPVKLKGFGNTYADGGTPRSGSLFMANENGNTELVGNFGGYTGVANQSMIIEAMQNAMVQAIRSAGGMGNGGTTVNNFNIGNWLGDDASVRKLANRINTVNAKSNSNIANVGFVMS